MYDDSDHDAAYDDDDGANDDDGEEWNNDFRQLQYYNYFIDILFNIDIKS